MTISCFLRGHSIHTLGLGHGLTICGKCGKTLHQLNAYILQDERRQERQELKEQLKVYIKENNG